MKSLLILVMLMPLLWMNLLVGLGKAIASRVGRRLAPSKVPPATRVEGLRATVDRALSRAQLGVTLLGLGLGIYAWVSGGRTLNVAWLALVVMLAIAFRNGADLSRSLVYARHDAKLVRARRAELPLGRILAPALALGIFTSTLFLALWAILFMAVKGSAEVALGAGAERWALALWGLGVLVGGVAHSIVARSESGLLLRDDLGVGAFAALAEGRGRSPLQRSPTIKGRRKDVP